MEANNLTKNDNRKFLRINSVFFNRLIQKKRCLEKIEYLEIRTFSVSI